MTLIIGIKCSDGIVIGADSAAILFDSIRQQTISQPVSKIHVIKDEIIVAISGDVGLAQLHVESIRRVWRSGGQDSGNAISLSRDLSDIRNKLHEEINKNSRRVYQGFEPFSRIISSDLLMGYITDSLVALPAGGVNGTLELVEFNITGTNQAATSDLPFVAIGSGKSIADPFLAHLRRIFWPDSVPTLSDGAFALFWTLDHSIRISPNGLSHPIDIVVMRQGKKNRPVIKKLGQEKLDKYRRHVLYIEGHMRELREDARREDAIRLIDEDPKPPSQPTA